MPRFQVGEDRHIGVVVVDLLELHRPPAQVVIAMQRRQMPVDRGDEVVVDRHGHAVGKERCFQGGGVISRPGVIDVPLDRSGERGGQRVLVCRELPVELVERRLANAPFGRVQESLERAVRQLDRSPLFVLDHAELEIGVIELAERLAGRVWAISVCMARSRSSLRESVCGLSRKSRSSSSR